MKLEQASPAPRLREYVRCFQQRRARIRRAGRFIRSPPGLISFSNSICRADILFASAHWGRPEIVPRSVIVGPCSRRRAELVLRGELEVFTIQFCPAGFNRLFRLPMHELADQAYDARSVIGPRLAETRAKACRRIELRGTDRRIASDLLLRVWRNESRRTRSPPSPTGFFVCAGALGIGDAAAEAGLGMRQFERRFGEQVGLPPKLYARIVRFNAALGVQGGCAAAPVDRHRPRVRIFTTKCTWSRISRTLRERAPRPSCGASRRCPRRGHDVAFLLSAPQGLDRLANHRFGEEVLHDELARRFRRASRTKKRSGTC